MFSLDFDDSVFLHGDGHAGLNRVEEFIPQVVDDGHHGIGPHVAQDGAGGGQRVDRLGENSMQAGCFPRAQAAKRTMPPVVEPMVCGRQRAFPIMGFL